MNRTFQSRTTSALLILGLLAFGHASIGAATAKPIKLRATTFDPAKAGTPNIPPGLAISKYAMGTRGYFIVQFTGPVTPERREQLEALGAEILEYVPEFAFKVRMDPRRAAELRRIANIAWVGPFHPAFKLHPKLVRDGKRLYRIKIEKAAEIGAVLDDVALTGADVVSHSGNVVVVAAESEQLDSLARLRDVAWIENFMLRERHNEYGAGEIMGSRIANQSGYDGATQTVAVADTGFGRGTADTGHPAIPGLRVERIYSWSAATSSCYNVKGNGARDEDSGHGTHVSVSVLGEGDALGQGKGVAPAAHLVFQAVEEYLQMRGLCRALYPNGYYLIGIPDDLRPMFQQAYDAGARIHSNSWGSDAQGDYTIDSANADDFVWTHPQMTITYSAGNAGIDADADGVIDPDSIGSPATAKNVITVGASENDRRGDYGCATELTYTDCAGQGGQNTLPTYGEAWPDDYPAEPIAGDPNAGNEEQMAAFSSRGPTDDGRIKPDVVAPGTWVLSGYSDLHQQGYDTTTNQLGSYQYDGWGFPLNRELKYMGGTSMSTPLVAGAAAVVRDFYQTAHGHDASAALVKATLINSAVDLLDENNDGIDDNDAPIPNEHEGWGRVDLVDATDGSRQFVDEETALQTGESATYTFDVPASGEPFKATLVWTDYPSTESAAKNLVNDLDLVVTAPSGTAYRGNVFDGGWSQAGGSADRTNNVENVYVRTPAAGTWTVDVRGFNVPDGPQPFALVVSGGTAAAVDNPPTTTVTDPGAAIDGTYRVLVGAVDDGAVAKVELAIDGGTYIDITANVAGEFHFYDWDTTGVADGTHTLRSRATDDGGRTAVSTLMEVTVDNIVDPPVAGLHVGDLDGSADSGLLSWTAVVEIAIHDGDEHGVAGATVRGTWSGGAKGSGYCTTGGSGRCRVSKWSRKGSVSFTVGTVTHPTLAYQPNDNHDPDGDSNGTTITVLRP